MIGLTTVNDTLELVTSEALALDYSVTYVDTTASTHVPGSTQGAITTATTTTILAAPGASTYRGVKMLSIRNGGAAPQTITLQKDVSGTNFVIWRAVLEAGEMALYAPETGFVLCDKDGRPRTTQEQLRTGGVEQIAVLKTMPAADNTWYHALGYDGTGSLPAWSPGTPGVNGRVTDGTDVADGGCLPLRNAPSGYNKFLTRVEYRADYAQIWTLHDVLWVNTGLAPATTGAQAITTPTFPARDNIGSVNGVGCKIGLLVTVACTNAAAIYNATVEYTNSAGTGSRTAVLSNAVGCMIPATAVKNTVVWFQLQAGDTGVKSIEGITLATSLAPSGSPAISLIVARPIHALTYIATYPFSEMSPGVRIYDGACILPGYTASYSATAGAYSGVFTFSDK